MATILLSAAGAAVGAGFGGTVLGLSGAVIGRAVGATVGRAIDQKLLGAGSQAVDVGRVDRFRLMGASDGAMIPLVWGRARVAGQVIWSTQFQETVTSSGSGKGAPKPRTRQFSYTVSIAVALCEGVITRVGRVWADGLEIEKDRLNLRVYRGTETQVADPKIAAVEGVDNAPAYRGTAYVVIEDLDLSRFGNRVPQFNFEVMRRAQNEQTALPDLPSSIQGVALVPGTGEYALATTRVHYAEQPGVNRSANVNSASGKTDFATSLEQLNEELPECEAVSLVVSWFGNDLRCGSCLIQPKVEQKLFDGVGMSWRAGGISRSAAEEVPTLDSRSVYGGTPSDAAVIEGIRAATNSGKAVMFYPFILMDQLADNTLPDPWTGEIGQPSLPWRGRITTSLAPDLPGSPDRTATATQEVLAFMGSAQPSHFSVVNGVISYSGPPEWRYRRFILHYAKLCAIAGGVEGFCIGSEMVSATRIRDENDGFPMVVALKQLASDVRTILGPSVKIGYAADWTEYQAYRVSGNLYFHLDTLWSDEFVDFIGIDNYMPLSDWRDGNDHADAHWESVYNLKYLSSNVAGGEGFDWYYDSPQGRANQVRLSIEDTLSDEPWVFRTKDILSWWSNYHHNRIDGVRQAVSTNWTPQSKPIRFTEYGCSALDKSTNQPNAFIDEKSSKSSLPYFSTGRRDDFIQHQYFLAFSEFWKRPENNVISNIYGESMIDMRRSYAWAWDTRPYPNFPANQPLWNDGANYARGHWLNGRVTSQPLANVVLEVCTLAGLTAPVSADLTRMLRGYTVNEVSSARAVLQPLSLAFSFNSLERDGVLSFRHRGGPLCIDLSATDYVVTESNFGSPEFTRASAPDTAGHVQIGFVDERDDYQLRYVDAIFPDETSQVISQSETGLVMNAAEARSTAERWLAESRVSRGLVKLSLPLSLSHLGAGDVFGIESAEFRIDRVERRDALEIEAIRIETGQYEIGDQVDVQKLGRPFVAPLPVFASFLDLPTLQESDVPFAPYIAAFSQPWLGDAAVWRSVDSETYTLDAIVSSPATVGVSHSALPWAQSGVWDEGDPLLVEIAGSKTLESVSELLLLSGANTLAIGDGNVGSWEVLQFQIAELVAPNKFALRRRLRGQLGSDSVMPLIWPTGSQIVVLDTSLRQLALLESQRGLEFQFRVGSLARGPEDESSLSLTASFDGNGLRPYSVGHLYRQQQDTGSHLFTWIRRTRSGGDSWQSVEVPLAEQDELYAVEVLKNGIVRRAVTSGQTAWEYTVAMQLADGVIAPFTVRVSQLSQAFGAGPPRGIVVSS